MSNITTNALLGYPPDARLLIVNADDFGMYHAINEAVVRALKEGIVCSTSLMVPWPGARRGMEMLKENPGISFAVHLSVICDVLTYRWGPLASGEQAPSLVDENGTFYTLDRMSELLAQARLDELEVEFRAQIEAVLAANLKPTHLDWHCLHNGGRADIFDMTFGLAKEYGLALRVAGRPFIEQVQSQGLPTDDYDLLDSFSLDLDGKSARYAQLLRDLPVGLSEWAVHPALDTAEARAVDPDGLPVRRTDFEFVMSPEAREIIRQEGIILLSYAPIQRVWRERLA